MKSEELIRIVRLLWSDPPSFVDEIATRLEVSVEKRMRPPRYTPADFTAVVEELHAAGDIDLRPFLSEPALLAMESRIERAVDELRRHAPFPLTHNGDFTLARLCYATCRAIRPAVVIETGVAYGVTSALILSALEQNGYGRLHSIDRPPRVPDAARFVGAIVPHDLRARWTLHRGTSRDLLPAVLRDESPVSLFIHDSRHTYRNILWELEAVTPRLTERAVVIADDIERNSAFEVWARGHSPRMWAALQEQKAGALCGVAVMHGGAAA